MLDIKFIKNNPGVLDTALISRNKNPIEKQLLSLDEKYRSLLTQQQQLQEKRNKLSDEIAKIKAADGDASDVINNVNDIKQQLESITQDVSNTRNSLNDILFGLPNIPSAECPNGKDENDNVEIRKWGECRKFAFQPLQHHELGAKLGMMDFTRSAKIAGARFVLLFSKLAKLERALAQFMLDVHTTENGYTEVYVPLLLNKESMFGVGQLPKFEEDLFKTTSGSYLIPTAEASLTNIHQDEVLKEDVLPLRYTAYTPCFRSEAGSAGRDTVGMIRQHQFGKVELVSITTPQQAVEEHERMTACAEGILQKLGLPYRTVCLSTGDMGFASEKTYDLEVWLPGQNTYREISSCSRCGTFQARRMNTKYTDGKKSDFVATLNGSGIAVGRCLIAIMENYQQEDGSITIPEILVPYIGEKTIQI